ncbi:MULTISPECIES: hypothetical protein [unclassified Pantoea]|uniref:hypothetical protein n=1 Tax=unclassified Pantoea TaxID=2630326 RepID=UPI0020599AEA|nr:MULTISPECIES: hypothetical protein [unclassified Pantoea]MDU5474030.1 hypothetical protein [Pantoea sp.]DAI70345.1 MAG TPA: hypothetical protein [Bacteriophage sp.]
MSIQGKDILLVAESCADKAEEHFSRSAISRAYYALYHEACSILQNCPPTTHDGVVQYLLTDSRRKAEPYELMDLIRIGAVLKQQKEKRKAADYDLALHITQTEATSSVNAVRKILDKISEIRS